MKTSIPLRKIIKLNLGLSLNTVLFVFVIRLLSIAHEQLSLMALNTLIGLICLLITSFGNLGLFLLFEKQKRISESRARLYFLTISYIYSIFIFINTPFLYFLFVGETTDVPLKAFLLLVILGILMNSYILALQHYVLIQEEKYRVDMENSKLKAVNFETANQLLKQQIQPHFLFNALNILKSLYKSDIKEGEKYLIHLSNFLRASLSNNKLKIIQVKEEIALCENYITMQKVRFGEALRYTVELSDQTMQNKYIPSFSIQPLIENAIKHNELTEDQPLIIQIRQSQDWIKVTNSKKIKTISPESTGIGLSNLSERYHLLSGEGLNIEEDDSLFSVSIKLLDNKTAERHLTEKT